VLNIIARTFTLNNQREFASFSGDFNPIHVDEIESIKTHAGQPIVHGVHLVLWSLDALKIQLKQETELNIKFESQVNLEEYVIAVFNDTKNQILITSKDQKKLYSTVTIKNWQPKKKSKPTNHEVAFLKQTINPDEPDISGIQLNNKDYDLYGGSQKELGKILFPFLVEDIGLNFVYEFACISSIVGMKIPGRHSLFVNLSLKFPSNTSQEKHFFVESKHDLLKIVSLKHFGINLESEIKAFFRPQPSSMRSINSLRLEYKDRNSLDGKRVLVIGGSRGIGAYVSKLCSIMGAIVTFTFNSNKQEAINLAAEIIDEGGNIRYRHLNVLDSNQIQEINEEFDHIYFFATPKILSNKSKEIDMNMLKKYRLFYVDSFERVINNFCSKRNHTFFLYPSTTYIDEEKSDFKEYINAKQEGENICKLFNKKFNSSILFPRIPALDTDQNLSIIPKKSEKTSDYAYLLIQQMIENDYNL
jgi:hypothetical protein